MTEESSHDSCQKQTRGSQETKGPGNDSRQNRIQDRNERETERSRAGSRQNQSQTGNKQEKEPRSTPSGSARGESKLSTRLAYEARHRKVLKRDRNSSWSDEQSEHVAPFKNIQGEQGQEKVRQERLQSRLTSQPKGLQPILRTDGEYAYSVWPPFQVRDSSFLGQGKQRGKLLPFCEDVLGVSLCHKFQSGVEFVVYAVPSGFEQAGDPKVRQKLQRAEQFLQYWTDAMQKSLRNRLKIPTIDFVLDDWIKYVENVQSLEQSTANTTVEETGEDNQSLLPMRKRRKLMTTRRLLLPL